MNHSNFNGCTMLIVWTNNQTLSKFSLQQQTACIKKSKGIVFTAAHCLYQQFSTWDTRTPGVTQAALRNTQNVKFYWLFFICGDANIRRKRTAGLLYKLFRQHSEIKTWNSKVWSNTYRPLSFYSCWALFTWKLK